MTSTSTPSNSTPRYTRRLIITIGADPDFPFLIETDYLRSYIHGGNGGWATLSRTSVREFPWKAVERVAGRADYHVVIRVADVVKQESR